MKIRWAHTAMDDLYEIHQFLLETWDDEKAFAVIEKLIERVDVLEKYPLLGQKEPLLANLQKVYRRLVEGRYKIIYHVGDDLIYINRVFDSRRNPESLSIDEGE